LICRSRARKQFFITDATLHLLPQLGIRLVCVNVTKKAVENFKLFSADLTFIAFEQG
jgi:hypothetical protein